MIDLTTESLHSLAQAVAWVPASRRGKRTHISTLLRWIIKGSRAPDGRVIRLEALRLGGRWLTSREALQRFAARLTPSPEQSPPEVPSNPVQRRRASERAAEELRRIGV